MERITGPGATPDNLFTEGNPSLGIDATTVTANWLNGVQEELIHILEEGGVTPDGVNHTQVMEALWALFVTKKPIVQEITWTPLVPGITSTVKTKKMSDNTLHIYGTINKEEGEIVSVGTPLLGIHGDPFGIGAGNLVVGSGFETQYPIAFQLRYDPNANETHLAYYDASWDSAEHFLYIWQVVPCLGLPRINL